MHLIPALGKASLVYIMKPCLRNNKTAKERKGRQQLKAENTPLTLTPRPGLLVPATLLACWNSSSPVSVPQLIRLHFGVRMGVEKSEVGSSVHFSCLPSSPTAPLPPLH